MIDRKKILREARLYVVLDSSVADLNKLFDVMKETVKAGATVVQLRSKEGAGRDILDFSKRTAAYVKGKALFIVNDRVDVALASDSDGVHLGQEDLPVQVARTMLGAKKLIGVSCQNLKALRQAQREGADYIGFGSVFKTKTKPERHPMDLKMIGRVIRKSNIPVFFIGGIGLNNISGILCNGGQRVAVTRAICEAKNVKETTREFLKVLRG